MMSTMDDNAADREGRVVRRIPPDTFGHRLLLARADAGLTIEQAAEKCGLLSQSWGNWERGRMPRDILDVTVAVSDGLGVDLDWLRDGGQLPRPAPRRARAIRVTYARRGRGDFSRRPRRIDGHERVAA